MSPITRKHNSRFASKNPFDFLEVSRHVSWAPLDPDFEAEPLPPTHSFFSFFPGEIRNAIYAHLLDVPKTQEAFGHELTLESDDIEKPLLHAVVLHEHARKLSNLVNLGLSCKIAAEEIFSMIKAMVDTSTTLVVKLNILQNTSFNLPSALQNLQLVRSGHFDAFKLLENATLRIIWPQDNLEHFYLGAPEFFKGLRSVPKCLQMQVPWGPWSTYLNNIKIDYGRGDFICQGKDAIFHRPLTSSPSPSSPFFKDGKVLLAWRKTIFNITTFTRTSPNPFNENANANPEIETTLDLGDHLRTQVQNHFLRAATWNRVRGRWEGFLDTGDWWQNKDLDARYSIAGKEIGEQGVEERKEKWFETCVVHYGLLG